MVSIHDRQSDVILDGSQRPKEVYTRDDAISRGISPIIGDPTMLATQTTEPISQQEIENLSALNIRVDTKPMGEGQHSIIYSGHFQDKATNQTVHCAVKRSFSFRQAWAELEALNFFGHKTPHKNIINYYGFYRSSVRMYLFIELSKMGDLSQYLSTEYGSKAITENDIYHLFRHIRNGIYYMHDNGYAHRDIKIHNILVFARKQSSRKETAKVVCKLCDFGSTRRYQSGDESRTVIGSPKTMAPEVNDTPYNAFIADVYSLGVILYQLSHDGQYPIELHEKHDKAMIPIVVQKYADHKRNPQNIKWSNKLSEPLKELLRKMLEPDPNRRIHLKPIYQSRWITHHRRPGASASKDSQYEESYSSGSESESESGSESDGSDYSDTQSRPKEGGRYRQTRGEKSHGSSDHKTGKSGHSGSSSGHTVGSETPSRHHNPKLDQQPYASGKEENRHGPTEFFE